MPRTSSFVLTEAQERDLIDYALQRVEGLRIDNKERIDREKWSWEAYENSRPDRISPNSIFERSNLVLPMTAMIVDSFVSRCEDEITGSVPFYRYRPVGSADQQQAEECNAYFQHKFGPTGANIKAAIEGSFEAAFCQRAIVFKNVWADRNAQWLDGAARILTNKATKKPIQKTVKGKPAYVTENDAVWNDLEMAGPAHPETGAPTVMKHSVLSDDPSIVWDEATMEFAPPPKALLRSQSIYRGAKAVLLDYDSYLCPTNAASWEEADFKCELYDKTLSWVKDMFIERPWLTWKDFRSQYRSARAKPQTKNERNLESKESLQFDQRTKSLKLIECWIRKDVLGWGVPQEFMLLIEPDRKNAVYYEFQANICPDLQSPYTVIAIAPKKGRWWGKTLPEKLQQFQDFVDRQFNRTATRNAANANPIGGYHPDAVEEEPDDIELGDGGLFRLKNGKDIKDFIEFAEVPDLDNRTKELLDFVIYWVQLWLAVSSISQGDYSNIPQNSTKYGIQATLREASKIGRRWIRRLTGGFEAVLRKMTLLQCNSLDDAEVYELLEGKVSTLREMTPEKLKSLDLNVSLVLGTQVSDMEIDAAKTALEAQNQYFMVPDPYKAAARPMFVQIFEALGFDDVDKMLPLPQVPPPAAMPPASMSPGAVPASGVGPAGTPALPMPGPGPISPTLTPQAMPAPLSR